jgi:hypothetical protein
MMGFAALYPSYGLCGAIFFVMPDRTNAVSVDGYVLTDFIKKRG